MLNKVSSIPPTREILSMYEGEKARVQVYLLETANNIGAAV